MKILLPLLGVFFFWHCHYSGPMPAAYTVEPIYYFEQTYNVAKPIPVKE